MPSPRFPDPPPVPVGGSLTGTTTTIVFDRSVELVSGSPLAWSVRSGGSFLDLIGVTHVAPSEIRITHLGAPLQMREVSMLQQVVAGEPDGTLAETFSDFPVN